ncbi:MAG: DinB family protein [Paenibacillus sp.]|nr:DinB family protein [Paenibacillus sp.]
MDMTERKIWNENHKRLTEIILNPNEHANAIELFLSQHAFLFSSKMFKSELTTLEDELFQNISEETLRKYPVTCPDTRNSIVWHLWHITRIEDMTMNVLVSDNDQVFHTGNWDKHLQVKFMHSGNGMSEDEVKELSQNIIIPALLSYRLEVGRKTREIISSIVPGQFKQKVEPARINKLEQQGAVKKEETWLLEYWGNKNIAGLVLMPATRHNFVHLNKSIRIKQKIQK